MPSVWSARLFRVTGRNFLPRALDRVSTWRQARTAAEAEMAINRPMKLRFPQGSEVWIGGCPKFATAGRSGLIKQEVKAKTVQPGLPPWRAVFAFPRS